ncbi:Gfo/Idh/MocA family oxidoreductase [Proteocatella sphenisci]|uniref:Gfo/Idh/MocA family oxidoreductase n=1 Tax=Proteocatella sphenisci TaxID=181070 RepID=UPI0004B8BB3B|nr:Gfo/Idh/MocA family oxidoreductase [Proteocatella sphenisci]
MKKLKVGLIGYGVGGRVFHEPIISSVDGFELHKIFSRSGSSNDLLIGKYDKSIIADKIEDIFLDSEIDLVVIALPNYLHFDMAKKALENYKHVLVEKPFTVTPEEANQLIALSQKMGRVISVNHNRRYDSDFRTVKKILDAGFLGNIVEYEAHFDRFRSEVMSNSWKEDIEPGSGILYDLGSHLIDQVQQLFGLPEEIFACLDTQRENAKTIDNFDILLKYKTFTARLKAGMLVREQGPRYMIHGSKGSFVKYGMDVQESSLKTGELPLDKSEWGKEPEAIWGTLNTDINDIHVCGKVESEQGDYTIVYKNLYDAICGNDKLKITPQQARNTIRIIELAQKSSELKAWVSL